MQLTCLGSSSSGNCYLLHNENEALVIEAGVSFKEVKKALNFDISKIVGCLVSHEHGDHAKYIYEFLNSGIKTLAPRKYINHLLQAVCLTGLHYDLGNFNVIPFELIHDVECYGFLIKHPETGSVCFITDTKSIEWDLTNLSNIIIEANYDEDIVYDLVMNDKLNPYHQNRVEDNHLSIQKTLQFLNETDLSKVNNIVLTHLSNGSSNAKEFKEKTERATGKTVHVADKGLSVNFNKTPF